MLHLESPLVMGIINLNDDSFYAESRNNNLSIVLKKVEQMINEGVDILDFGALSSQPGSQLISEDIERIRLEPILKEVIERFPEIIISVDTFRSKIAKLSLEMNVGIINDIYASRFDLDMLDIVAKGKGTYIMMHMQGNPLNMQENPVYGGIITDLLEFFKQKIYQAIEIGIKDIVIDPGFGFGKTIRQNYELLRNLDVFSILGVPILAGISRKSMISKRLNINSEESLNGTTAAHMIALMNNAKILRVHDVKQAKECITIFNETYLSS